MTGLPTPTEVARSGRIVLRHWDDADHAPFAAMCADPRVMEHFPKLLSRDESELLATRIRQAMIDKGFGMWALEIPGVTRYAGFVGLSRPFFEAHFTPCVEVGWRLMADYWGHGYATEAARAALRVGFRDLGFDEIVSMTIPANVRSRNVMQKLGMHRDPADDFDHPNLLGDDRLRRHVLYRLGRAEWELTTA
jgi:RimJ/RimL family protein N-acetyltransferase